MNTIKPHNLNKIKSIFIKILPYKLVFLLSIGLLTYRLLALVPGMSKLERPVLTTNGVGTNWHELVTNTLWLPLSLIQTIASQVFGHPGAIQLRIPSVFFGALAILLTFTLVRQWHGQRNALLVTVLFATNAWVLHISRLGTVDALYLLVLPTLLVIQMYMVRLGTKLSVARVCMAVCGFLLFVPGAVWFVALSLFWQRGAILLVWQAAKTNLQKIGYLACGLIWLPLLGYTLRSSDRLILWLGLPNHINTLEIGRQIAFVPVHLFIRGPLDNTRWLGHAPILDVASLVFVLVGIWFYVFHISATRSKILGSFGLLSVILIGLNGAVPLSAAVPLLFVCAAMGIAYLLRNWFNVFPINPIARITGVAILATVIVVASGYNLRAYFIAWPKDITTLATFK